MHAMRAAIHSPLSNHSPMARCRADGDQGSPEKGRCLGAMRSLSGPSIKASTNGSSLSNSATLRFRMSV